MVFSRTVLAGLTVALTVLGASKTAFGASPDSVMQSPKLRSGNSV